MFVAVVSITTGTVSRLLQFVFFFVVFYLNHVPTYTPPQIFACSIFFFCDYKNKQINGEEEGESGEEEGETGGGEVLSLWQKKAK